MLIVETSIFTKQITELMPDEDYRALQEALIVRPELGDIIKGSGGLRKVRWKLQDRGKSSGARIIYYWMRNDQELRMLFAPTPKASK